MTIRQLKNRLSQLSAQIEARQKADVFIPLAELPYWLRSEQIAKREQISRLCDEYADDPEKLYDAVCRIGSSGISSDSFKPECRAFFPDRIAELFARIKG